MVPLQLIHTSLAPVGLFSQHLLKLYFAGKLVLSSLGFLLCGLKLLVMPLEFLGLPRMLLNLTLVVEQILVHEKGGLRG
ncbi:hypothetical protein ACOSQ3_004490 [Xanthoceras sorbifolium]